MSYIFDVGEETVWSPSLRVGEWYVSFVESAAAILGCRHGLQSVASDMYIIDPEEFAKFTLSLRREYLSTDHPVLRAQIHGILLTSMVLLKRSGFRNAALDDEQRALELETHAFERAMAR